MAVVFKEMLLQHHEQGWDPTKGVNRNREGSEEVRIEPMGVARNNSFLKLLREGDRDGGRARARERRRRGRVGEEIKEMAGIHTSSGTPYC
jgi:hypothetical protein